MDDVWVRFEQYVRTYLPDWQYQRGGPELEAALMTAMGELVEDSRTRLEKLPEKHQREYLCAWDTGPEAEEPMYVYAALSAPKSTQVPKGSVYYRSGDGTKCWETAEDTWAQAGQLRDQVFSGGECGKIIRMPVPTYEQPIKLFDFRRPGIQKREVRFAHPAAFSSQAGCLTALRLENADDGLLGFFCDPAMCVWFLEAEEGRLALDTPARKEDTLQFHLPPAERAKALLVQVNDGRIPPTVSIRRALVGTARVPGENLLILADSGPCQNTGWLPFGDRLTQWNTCYVSCPDALCLPGAQVTFSWVCSVQSKEELLPGMEEEPEYRPIMRRLPKAPPPIRDVRADLVLWEYWDGTVWRVIPGTEGYSRIFSDIDQAQDKARRLEVQFRWPNDAHPCGVQGVNTHWLRWRLSACEGAGWLPARYHAPELSQLSVTVVLPASEAIVEQCCGTDDSFQILTEPSRKVLFPSIAPEQDCWWLGFDTPPGGDMFSLYLTLGGRGPGGTLSACEETPDGGTHPLSLSDQTDGLAHSGMITLHGISGQRSTRFGMDRWWVCIREETGIFHREGGGPMLVGIAGGAARLKAAAGDCCTSGEWLQPLHGGFTVGRALSDSFGGVPEESDEEILSRLQQQRHHLERIVSPTDAEQLICGRVRDVVRVRCVRSGDTLQVGLLMRDVAHHEAAFRLRQGKVQELLREHSVLPSLGLSLQVREPRFYPVHVMIWVSLVSGDNVTGIKRQIERTLRRFLDPVSGHFGGTGWRMGELPTPAQMRACLQSAVPGISLVELVTSTTTPEGKECDPLSIQDPFALPLGGNNTIFSI